MNLDRCFGGIVMIVMIVEIVQTGIMVEFGLVDWLIR
jgi:type IV secretory pathway VirB2 component (pilin)